MTKKKKAKKAEVKEQKKAPSKSKSNALAYIVGAIIVIVIIVALVLLLKGRQAPQAPTGPTTPSERPTETATEKPTAVSEKPGEIRYCTEEFAIGWPKNKLGQPCKVDGNVVTANITYSGKGDKIDGMWFYVNTTNGDIKYLKDTRVVKNGESLLYTVDVGTHIESMIALPQSAEAGKVCLNQRLLVIKAESCVAS